MDQKYIKISEEVTNEAEHPNGYSQRQNLYSDGVRNMIDAHSHYGRRHTDTFESLIYFRKCNELGVNTSILMTMPSPVIRIEQEQANYIFHEHHDIIDLINLSNVKEFDYHTFIRNNRVRPVEFCKGITINGNLHLAPIEEDPYLLPNLRLLEKFKDISNVRLALFLHPNFTSQSVFEYAANSKVVAFKLHGTAGCFVPTDIHQDIISAIKYSDLPLIVHTDYDRNPPAYKREFILGNMPMHWIKFAQRHGFRIYLTHGARLDTDVLEEINGSERFLIGTGPAMRMAEQSHKLKSQVNRTEDYLVWLVNQIKEDNLAFDFDYPWNIEDGVLDWNDLERLKKIIKDELLLDKVLDKNARRFFKI